MNSSQESLISHSQEMLGPLSQETLAKSLNMIPKEIFDYFMKNNFANLSPMEVDDSEIHNPKEVGEFMASLEIPNMEISQMQSSIPVTENFPGFYDFNVLTGPEDNSKKCRYTFSPVTNKLYVKRDFPCPFNFSTNQRLDGFVIRAMLFFSSPENRCENVERCLTHSDDDLETGDENHMHFIRSSSKSAGYYNDTISNRMSITVNYENPAIGECYTTYLFRFMCYTSCSGGPNRRPMCVVFTLEKNEKPFGRCKIDLKVCSDPKRDRSSDEDYLKRKETFCHLLINPNQPSKPENNVEKSEEECFFIKTFDKEEYNYLRSLQRFYHMNKLIKTYNWIPTVPDMKKLLRILSSNSYDGSD